MPISNLTSKISTAIEIAVGANDRGLKNVVRNDLTRSPSKDCFISVPQGLQAEIKTEIKSAINKVVSDSELIQIKQNLRKQLEGSKDNNGKAIFGSDNIEGIISLIDTPEKAQFAEKLAQSKYKNGVFMFEYYKIKEILSSANTPEKAQFGTILLQLRYNNGNAGLGAYDIKKILLAGNTPEIIQLAKKLAKLEDKSGNARFNGVSLTKILSSANTPEKAQLKFDLASELTTLEDKRGNLRLSSDYITPILIAADTPGKAKVIVERACNKEFLLKIDALDSVFGHKLYAEIFKSEMNVDLERINKLYKYFCENKINLQQHGEERVTNESIVCLFDSKMLKAIDLLDDGVIKYATKLKYKNFKNFIDSSSSLVNNLDSNAYNQLRENLSKISDPGMNFERLQSIIALNKVYFKNPILNIAIGLIKSPRTTEEQVDLASEIFTSQKTYQEKIQEFFVKFNVPEDKQVAFRKFFEKQKNILEPKTQKTSENQVLILDKKIQDVNGNDQIPEAKKIAYITQLQKQKIELRENLKSSSMIKLSDKAINLLSQQIERNINIPNCNEEFNSFLNSQIYQKNGLEPTPELLKLLKFDNQYFPNLFSALSNREFAEQFRNLITLVKENPSKPLSELRETLAHNGQTKKLFEQNGINYSKWTNFDEHSSLPFSFETDLQEAIRGVELNIVNELNGDLFKSVSPIETGKILKALADAGYKLDSESITKNGQEITQKDLEKIVDIFKDAINQNPEFWDKPLADANAESIKNELIDHLLKGRKKEVADLATMANVKMDLVVRLSNDDDISRNLFLGNHVGCCTSVEGVNGFAASQHLMNSFVRAMEIVDGKGNSYGNSMCYFAKVDDKMSFIIDSFEANGKLGGNEAVTDAIVDYARQVTKEMGKPDIPIYFGPNYNKINMLKFQKTLDHKIEVIGRVEDETYIDAIGGKGDINAVKTGRALYEV